MARITAWTSITLWDLLGELFLWALAVLLVGFALGFVCGRYASRRRDRGGVAQ